MRKLARLDAQAFDRAVAAYRAGSHEVAKSLLERIALQEPGHAGARFVRIGILGCRLMGAPGHTLTGQRCVGRAGISQTRALDLPELAPSTEDELVERATALVRRTDRLSELRRTLRSRLKASPLMDGARFAASFEQLLRTVWREWCDGTPSD